MSTRCAAAIVFEEIFSRPLKSKCHSYHTQYATVSDATENEVTYILFEAFVLTNSAKYALPTLGTKFNIPWQN